MHAKDNPPRIPSPFSPSAVPSCGRRSDLPLPPSSRFSLEAIPNAPQKLRILLCAKRKAHTRVTAHFIRGFQENGHVVTWLNTNKVKRFLGSRLGNRYLRRRIKNFHPDLLLLYHHDAPMDLFDMLPEHTKKAVFYEDAPKGALPDPRVVVFATKSDVVFTTARGYVPYFLEKGSPRAYYLRSGCDLTDHYPVSPNPRFQSDIAFIGGANESFRIDLLKEVQDKYQLTRYGPGWKEAIGSVSRLTDVYPKQYRSICSSAKILLGIDARDDLDLYFSNRTWLSLACGAFLITRYIPNLEEHFTNHWHLVWYKSIAECLELIEYYLPKEKERREIAQRASDFVREYHTFRHATAELVAKTFEAS